MFEPKKVNALAKPGQVAGYGRLISRKRPDPHYAEAVGIAYANPTQPVIVHEWRLPDDQTLLDQLNSYVHAEVRAALQTCNAADQARILDVNDLTDAPVPGRERVQVSSTANKDEGVVRTWVVFHPEGRPVRRRKRSSNDEQGIAADIAIAEAHAVETVDGPSGEPLGTAYVEDDLP